MGNIGGRGPGTAGVVLTAGSWGLFPRGPPPAFKKRKRGEIGGDPPHNSKMVGSLEGSEGEEDWATCHQRRPGAKVGASTASKRAGGKPQKVYAWQKGGRRGIVKTQEIRPTHVVTYGGGRGEGEEKAATWRGRMGERR